MKFIILIDLDTNNKYKQTKITPKFIVWKQYFGEH